MRREEIGFVLVEEFWFIGGKFVVGLLYEIGGIFDFGKFEGGGGVDFGELVDLAGFGGGGVDFGEGLEKLGVVFIGMIGFLGLFECSVDNGCVICGVEVGSILDICFVFCFKGVFDGGGGVLFCLIYVCWDCVFCKGIFEIGEIGEDFWGG